MLHEEGADHSESTCIDVEQVSISSCGGQKRGRTQHACSKTVRFAEEHNLYYHNTISSKKDYRRQWYRKQDYQVFRKEATDLATELVKADKKSIGDSKYSYQSVLEDCYHACCDAAFQYDEEDDNEDDISKLSKDALTDIQRRRMRKCVQLASTRLGLEHATLKAVQQGRSQQRQLLYARIHHLQNNMEWGDHHVREETLQRACADASRSSRLFAHFLARHTS